MKKKWLWTGIAVACFAATVAVGCGGVNWRDDPGEETTEYEVVFMNGEEEFWSVSVAEGDPVPQPEGTPEKAADDAYTYTFAGWSLEEEGEVTSLATAVSEDMTYYAVFTPESKETVYTVTFVDGVTGEAIDVQRVPLGGDAALPQAPVHEGFTFTGWEGDHTDIDRRTDIVAQYSRNSYTLTLGALGGTSTQEVLFEGALAPEAPEVPQGLLFEGWFVEEEGAEPVLLTEKYPNGMPAADVSATAHFAVDFSGVKLTATDVPVYGDSVALQLPSYEGMSYSYEWSDGSTEAQFPWKGAGSQTASVTVSARYENAAGAVVTGKKTLTSSADVVKATLTVTLSAEDVTYGQTPAPEASFQGFVLGESEEVLGGALTYLFNGSAEAPVHAGNYALSASGLTSENYSIEYKGAGFSIQKAALNVTVTLKSDALVYGTQPQAELAFAGLVAGDEALKASFAVSYTLNGNEADASRLTVGTYSVAAKASQQLTDYAVTAPSVQLTVERKPITLAVTVGNITYGETPAPQVTSDGFVYGEGMSELTGGYFTYFKGGEAVSGRLSAGTYTVKTGGYTARNYTVTDGEAQFTVNKKAITVTVSASQSSYPYTTQASAIAGNIRPDGLIPGETSGVLSVGGYELQKDGKPVTGMPDAGSYTLTASVTAENYAVTVKAGSVTIAPLAVTVSASGRQDALTQWSTDAFITTLPEGFAFSGTLSLNEEDAGTYTDVAADFTWTQPYAVSYQGEPVRAENFAFTFNVSVTLDLLTFKVNDSDFAFETPYTGVEIALGSGIDLPGYEEFKAEYRMDGGTYSASLPTGVNARNYTVEFRLSAKNYKAYEGNYTAVITQAENAIEVSLVTGYMYNGKAQTVAFKEFISAEFGTVVLKTEGSNVFTAAGTHTFEVQVVATNNYMGATATVTVEFAKAPLTVTLSGSSTYTALSADMEPALSAKMLGDDEIRDLLVTGVTFKQNGEVKSGMLPAGDYTVTAKVTDPSGNYIVEVQEGTFTVAKRAITVSVTGSGPAETEWSTQTFTAEGLQGFAFAGKLVLPAAEADAKTYDAIDSFKWETPLAVTYGSDDVTANFTITYDVSVTIDKLDFTKPSVTSEPLTYNTAAQKLTANIAHGLDNVTVTYSREENGEYTTSVPTGTNADTYTVWYKLSRKNYNDYTDSYTVTIQKAENNITPSKELSAVYNGKQVLDLADYFKATDGVITGTFTVEGVREGGYSITVSVAETKNYKAAEETFTFTVTPRQLTVTIGGGSIAYAGEFTPTVTGSGYAAGEGDELLRWQGFTYWQGDKQFTDTYLPVGSYTVRAEVTAENYQISYTYGTLTVAKRAVTVEIEGSGDAETEWSKAVSVSDLGGLEGFTFAGTLSLAQEKANASQTPYTDVKEFEWTTQPEITLEGVDVTENFIITYDVSVTINFLTFSDPDVTPEPLTYNTAAQGLTAKFDLNGLDNVTLTYSREENGTYTKSVPTGTNADTYTVWYKLSRKNYTDYTGSYTVTIKKAENDITPSKELSVTYKGADFTLDAETYFTAKGGAELALVPDRTIRDAGSYTLTVTAAETDNYKEKEEIFTFTVKQAEIKAEIKLNESYTYADPMGLQLSAVLLGGDELDVLNVDYTYWQGDKQVKDTYLPVGEYTVKAEVTAKNYIVTVADGNFSVTPRTLTITAIDTDAPAGTHWTADKDTLGGNDLPKGFVFAEGVLMLNALDYREDPYVAMSSAIGEFEWTTQPKITLNGADVTGNFALRYLVQVTLNALKFEDSDFETPSGSAGTYTGKEIPLGKITDTQDRDITATYRVEEEGEFTETLPAATDAGTYTVYFKVTAQYYAEYEGQFTVSIAKAANEINLKEDGALDKFVYNGAERTLDAAEYFTATDGTVTGSVKFKDAQQYTFTVNVAATENYEAASKEFKFTVGKKAITVLIETNGTYTYGEPVVPKLKAALCEGDSINLFAPEYSYTKGDASAEQSPYFSVGSYTVTATIKDTKNYHIDSVTPAEFTVKPYTVTISASATQNAGTQWEMSSFNVSLPADVTLTGTLALATTADGSYTANGDSLESTSFEWTESAQFMLNDTDVTENFAFNYDLSVTLEEIPFKGVNASNQSTVYTGREIDLTTGVTVTERPAGFKIEFSLTKDGSDWSTELFRTDADEYTVYFRITADNYQAYNGSYTFTINQAENNIRPTGSDTITVTYNGEYQAIDFADRFTADFGKIVLKEGSSNVFKDAGDHYEFVICVAGTKNYAGAVYTVRVKVEQAELTVTVGADASYTYADEIKPTIRPSGFVGNDNESLLSVPKYTFTKVGGGVVADKYLPVGDYTVTADVTAGNNYKVIVKEASFTVTARVVNVTVTGEGDAEAAFSTGEFTLTEDLPAGFTLTGGVLSADKPDVGTYSYEQLTAAGFELTDPAVKLGEADVTGNFTFEYTVNVTINELTFTADDFETPDGIHVGTYEAGEAIALGSGGVTHAGGREINVTYRVGEEGEYTTDVPAAVNAGEYTVYFKVTSKNYEEFTGSYTVFIDRAENKIMERAPLSVTYNGEEWVLDAEEYFTAYEGATLTLKADETIRNAGSYTLTVTAAATSTNYKETTAEFTFTVKKADLTVTFTQCDVEYTTPTGDITPQISANLLGDDAGKESTLLKVGAFTFVPDTQTVAGMLDAGDYTVTADVTDASGNYNIAAINGAEFAVTQKEVTVSVTGEGPAESALTDYMFDDSKLPAGFAFAGALTLPADKADAGVYKDIDLFTWGSAQILYGDDDKDVTANFAITYTVEVTITRLDFEDVLADKDFSFTQVYTGSAITLGNGIVLEDIKGFGVTYGEAKGSYTQDIPEKTDAGEYIVYFKLTGRNYHNYEGSYTAEITQAPNKITATDTPLASYTYNGYDQTVAFADQFRADFGTIVLMAENGNVFKNAGEHTFTIGVEATKNWAEATYQVTVNFAKAQITVTLEAEDVAYADDTTPGMTAELLGEDANKDAAAVLGAGGEIKYSYTAADPQAMRMRRAAPALLAENVAPLTVGSYTVDAEITAQNYVVTEVIKDTFEVTPRTVTVTVTGSGPAESMWTQAVTGENTDLPEGFTFAGTLALAQMDVGTYKAEGELTDDFEWQKDWQISYNGAPVAAENFALTYALSVELTPLSFEGKVTVGDAPDLTYNTEAQSLKAEISVPGVTGYTVQYSLTQGSGWEADVTATNANEAGYTVYFKVSRKNYEDYTGKYTVKIDKADNIITAIGGEASLTAVYKGADFTLVAEEYFTAKGGAELALVPDRTIRDAGSYTLTVTAAETDNYKAAEKTFTFTVTPAPLTVTLAQEDVVYTTAIGDLTPTVADVTGLRGSDGKGLVQITLGTVSLNKGDFIIDGIPDVGDYILTADVTAGNNYIVEVVGAEFSVTPVSVTVKVEGKGTAEDAWTYSNSGMLTGLPDGFAYNSGTLTLNTRDADTYTYNGTNLAESEFAWSQPLVVNYQGKNVTKNLAITYDLSVTLAQRTDWDYPQVGAYDAGEYTGKEIALGSGITYENSPKGFEVHYRLGEDGEWQTTVPTAINADEYTVYYYFTATNYKPSETRSYQATIAKVSGNRLNNLTASVTYAGERTLTAEEIAQLFTAKRGTVTLVAGENATVNNVGEYRFKVYVPATDNYEGVPETEVTVIVEKATYTEGDIPKFTLPEYTIFEGMRLNDIELPEGFAWADETNPTVTAGKDQKFAATYCLDPLNYEVYEGLTISVTINKMKVNLTVSGAGWAYEINDATLNDELVTSLANAATVSATTENGEPFTGAVERMYSISFTIKYSVGGTYAVAYIVEDHDLYEFTFVNEQGVSADGSRYYAPFKIKSVDYGGTLYTIEEALNAAASGTIIVKYDSSFADANVQYVYGDNASYYTVRDTVTLLLPFRENDTIGYNEELTDEAPASNAADIGDPYVTLTLGKTVTLISNGTITVGGFFGAANTGAWQGSISIAGCYARIDLAGGAIESSGNIDIYGFIVDSVGDGSITAAGGVVRERMEIPDWRGGSVGAAVFMGTKSVFAPEFLLPGEWHPDQYNEFPFKEYELNCIKTTLTIVSGVRYSAIGRIYTSEQMGVVPAQFTTVDFDLVDSVNGENALIRLQSGGSAVKEWQDDVSWGNGEQSRVSLTVSGGAVGGVAEIRVKVGNKDIVIDTKYIAFPLAGNLDLVLKDGTYSSEYAYKMMPGATLTLKNATLTLNNKFLVYTEDDINYSGTNEKYPQGRGDAALTVGENSTLVINGAFGGVVRGAGGSVQTGAGAAMSAQATEGTGDKSGDFIIQFTYTATSTINNIAQLMNENGTLTNMEAGKTYTYTNGTWA